MPVDAERAGMPWVMITSAISAVVAAAERPAVTACRRRASPAERSLSRAVSPGVLRRLLRSRGTLQVRFRHLSWIHGGGGDVRAAGEADEQEPGEAAADEVADSARRRCAGGPVARDEHERGDQRRDQSDDRDGEAQPRPAAADGEVDDERGDGGVDDDARKQEPERRARAGERLAEK